MVGVMETILYLFGKFWYLILQIFLLGFGYLSAHVLHRCGWGTKWVAKFRIMDILIWLTALLVANFVAGMKLSIGIEYALAIILPFFALRYLWRTAYKGIGGVAYVAAVQASSHPAFYIGFPVIIVLFAESGEGALAFAALVESIFFAISGAIAIGKQKMVEEEAYGVNHTVRMSNSFIGKIWLVIRKTVNNLALIFLAPLKLHKRSQKMVAGVITTVILYPMFLACVIGFSSYFYWHITLPNVMKEGLSLFCTNFGLWIMGVALYEASFERQNTETPEGEKATRRASLIKLYIFPGLIGLSCYLWGVSHQDTFVNILYLGMVTSPLGYFMTVSLSGKANPLQAQIMLKQFWPYGPISIGFWIMLYFLTK